MSFSTYQYARFVNQQITTTSPTTIYTVPASTQVLIKDIEVINTAANQNFSMTIGGGVPLALYGTLMVTGQGVHWSGLVVMNAAEVIQAFAGTTSGIWLIISGQTAV